MMASESAGMLASGKITPQKCLNMKHPYEHQDEAMMSLDRMEKKSPSYSTLVVLPTGGGKTYTAATWLLRTALEGPLDGAPASVAGSGSSVIPAVRL